nr:replication protein A 70 kDa DNA-binding subunit B-like [Ipomoea batatas]GMD64574.1 replication protein A 70 kDa DNA-binding subunit B-like [Ipomoea batatas]
MVRLGYPVPTQQQRLKFNYECPEFFKFKERSRISGSGTIEALSSENITLTSLKDIYDNKKVGEFWVLGEILSVESEWYFNACMNKVCGKKLQDCTDQMYCKPCNTYSPDGIIKYKVVIDVLDDDQDGPLVLWENVKKLTS